MKITAAAIFILVSLQLAAQSKSEKKLFQTFVSVCNAYKQLPLQLTVNYNKASNFPLREADSKVQEGFFYFTKNAGYIKFGELEQIITDSLVLVVMQGIKQMLLTETSNEMGAQLNKMMQMPVSDSNINILATKYNISQAAIHKDTMQLHITSKQKITGGDVPLEEILARYNPNKNEPQIIETLKRSLIKKDKITDTTILAATVNIAGKGDYLIKEETTFFVYKSITHNTGYAMPVMLSDRVEKKAGVGYEPVKAFEEYKLILN